MDEIIEGNPFEEKKRPQFLIVLCTISIIFSGLVIIGGILSMNNNNSDYENERIEEINQSLEEIDESSSFKATINEIMLIKLEHKKELDTIDLICTLLTLLGVIMMWKLKKKGFFVYLVAHLMSIISTVIFFGFGAVFISACFFSILFIVLYAMNLKHMS